MTIYEHRDTITISAGSASTTTVSAPGGVCTQVLVRALTGSTTLFRVQLEDRKGIPRVNYGWHELEINDHDIRHPFAGAYTLRITNASATDTFYICVAVEERH